MSQRFPTIAVLKTARVFVRGLSAAMQDLGQSRRGSWRGRISYSASFGDLFFRARAKDCLPVGLILVSPGLGNGTAVEESGLRSRRYQGVIEHFRSASHRPSSEAKPLFFDA